MSGTIAIIGTAGRQADALRINSRLYDAMFRETVECIERWDIDKAISGGAAVADHLAVRAFLECRVKALELYLPAPFERGRFRPKAEDRSDPGMTTNRYHDAFSKTCDVESLREIEEAIRLGAKVEVYNGFHRRNLEVANRCTHMLALTFGENRVPADLLPDMDGFRDSRAAGLKDGGTAHTWGECWKARVKRHASLTFVERSLQVAAS